MQAVSHVELKRETQINFAHSYVYTDEFCYFLSEESE